MKLLKKILIVDDEEDLCLMLQKFFTGKDHQVAIAGTLKEEMHKIDQWHPDILLLDNNLPDGMGWEKAANLLDAYPALEIHLISAFHPTFPVYSKSNRLHLLEKPISQEGLRRIFE